MTDSVASAAASSIMSHRSSSASVRSQKSERSYSSYSGDVGGGSSISSRTSLQDGLDSIKKPSSTTNDQNENNDAASSWPDVNASRRSSTTSKSSTTSTAKKKLGQVAENSVVVSGAVSVISQHSSISKTSSLGQASRNSSSTVPISNVTESSRLGNERYHEGKLHLERGEYIRSISLFTQAIQLYQKEITSGSFTEQQQGMLANMYSHRCEALYAIGAYPASVRDGRKALECEKKSSSSLFAAVGGGGGSGSGGVHPYSKSAISTSLSNGEILIVEGGAPLRAKVLCSLGYALLGGGDVKGVKAVFQESINVAKRVLEDVEDLTDGNAATSNNNIRQVVALMKETVTKATTGQSLLDKYERLKMKWDTKSYMGDNNEILDGILDIAPGAIDWHVSKVIYLIRCQRWFAVANHCEQVATRAMKYEGVFRGDLADMNPFSERIPPVQELKSRFFDEDGIGKDKSLPPHLRTLSPNAARDAAFRLPNELLLYYLRALRLDERYTSAVKVGMALLEFHEQGRSTARYAQEFETLDRTIKVKEEGDKMYRYSNYERALTLYGECLNIDGSNESGRRFSILRHPPVAYAKANSEGGKLHAVLHSNRAACFMAMGRYQDAILESSHAILIHSTYTKAILRRARCYAKIGEFERARADYNRLIMLVEGARKCPYPPKYQGSTCYFDMPSEVTSQQLAAIKFETTALNMHPKEAETREDRRTGRRRQGNLLKVLGRPKKWCSNCMKNTNNQVVRNSGTGEKSENRPSKKNDRSAQRMKRVSFKSTRSTRSYYQPQQYQASYPHAHPNDMDPTLANRRPPFEHPLDPPIPIDTSVDYYAILGVPRTASGTDIKKAYHKLALKYHPDRNSSVDASARFQEISRAYAIIGDSQGKKDEYDHKKLDP